ncbi:MAG TPA: glycoside hydrolase family 3 N-terminal domain-containing protein [Terriglobia bacterium]|nr:glycoside hydrolase family 3 N-terminal domain-containing protein [Terriglobia bacterium]
MRNPCSFLVALLLVCALVFDPPGFAQKSAYARVDRQLTKKEENWVRQTIRALTLDEKIGQMMTVGANAVFMNRDSEEYKKLGRYIVNNKVGGLILSRSQVWAAAILTNRLQEMARVPLLVSADLEMGPGMRLDDTAWWPPNMAVAATGDVRYARLQGSTTAVEARAAGINWLYAPVADVNNNPGNPVINVRSYGEDPEAVGAFVSAFVEGAQAAGALATAKHFPGHGDTTTDSHAGLPVVDVSKERLEKLELVPFRAAIASGVGSIMTAHIALPQIEPQPAAPLRSPGEGNALPVTLPATLSHKILTGLLRDELAFKGLVVTDAMEMAGVAARYDAATSAVQAVKAGADVILESPDLEASIRAIKEAVARGEITESRINASVQRILRAKAALGLNERRTVDLNEVDRIVSGPQFNAVAQEIADRSITLVRNEGNTVPLGSVPLLAVSFTDDENRAVTQPFMAELRRSGAVLEDIVFDSRSTDAELASVRARLSQPVGAVIYCVFVRSVMLPAMGARLAEEIGKVKAPVVVISFGNPYALAAIPNAPAYIAAYGPYPVSQRAAARALVGDIDIAGRLPVTLPGLYPRGHGLQIRRK